MNGDYLWDGSGEPDPEVERLERLLRPLRHDQPLTDLRETARPRRNPWGGFWSVLAAAAGFVVAAATWLAPGHASWEVSSLEGAPRLDGGILTGSGRLGVGGWLETDASSRARIAVGAIGEVEIEPRTRVGLVDAGRASHRLTLPVGVMHAFIWAPPGNFFVETPSAVAVDMGCAYTLEVDDSGTGVLTVQLGWVGFEHKGRESFVPQGGRCLTRPGFGPGTPYYETASQALREALETLDFGPASGPSRSAALHVILAEARVEDALTLWHLLPRVAASERPAVFERMAALLPPPQGVTREGVLRGERGMLDAWWDALGLGSASWWRLWKQPAPPEAR